MPRTPSSFKWKVKGQVSAHIRKSQLSNHKILFGDLTCKKETLNKNGPTRIDKVQYLRACVHALKH
eukprot:50245-Amphidinium_carterae.2